MIPWYLRDIIQTGVVTSTVAVLLWSLQYTLTAPWWRDPVGRTIIAKDAALLVLLVPNCLSIFWRHYLPPLVIPWTDAASLILVTAAMLWRAVVWFRIAKPRISWPAHQHHDDVTQEVQGNPGSPANHDNGVLFP